MHRGRSWRPRRTSARLRALRRKGQQSGWGLLVVAALCGCAHAGGAGPAPSEPAFGVDGTARPEEGLDSMPWLRERVLTSPYTYFRFVNSTFVGEVCRRLGPTLEGAQRVNLHGDAHLEQFAVTDTGRGLTDFDDSAKGPAAIDLVRFATSLRLVTDARGWSADPALDRFFAGYRTALADPGFQAPEPALVTRVRATFRFDAAAHFTEIEGLMEAVDPALDQRLRTAFLPYVTAMRAADGTLPPTYFEIRKVGRTRVGIGSARANKFLVRIEGPSAAPDDDLLLELKAVGEVPQGTCVERGPARDPLRPIVGQARIAYEPYRMAGHVTIEGTPYWVHAWARNYCEVSGDRFGSIEELAEISFDAGVQLGLGHPRYIAAPFEAETRAGELAVIGKVEAAVRLLSRQLADEITASWRRAAGKP